MKYLKQSIIFAFALGALAYFSFSERGPRGVHAKFLGGPPLSMTGAPGEGTCVGCHYTYGEPNKGLGHVRVTGLPAVYTPGQTYNLTVTVSDPQARSWGFEMTAVDATGTSTAVGNLTVADSVTTAKRAAPTPDGKTRTYLSHFTGGIYQGQANSASWSFTWTAPNASVGDIIFYASGNAANNQVSPEDDYIYTTAAVVKSPNADRLTALSAYSASSGATQVDLTVQGTFDAGAKIVFYGTELTTQAVAGGLSASIPANLLGATGAYPVAVKQPSGALTNTRFFALSSAVNPQAATTTEGASYTLNVAPGSIASLFGTRLVVSNTGLGVAPSIPLPLALKSSTVYVNGVPAPLYYAGDTQMNFQIPFGTAPGTASVVVLRGDGEISRGMANILAAAPALLTTNQQGTGQVLAQNAVDYSLNGDPASLPGAKRVKKGDYLIFYGTGTGADLVDFTTRQSVKVADGMSAGASPLVATAATPTVTIGGKAATVGFSGLHPVYVGVWQLNVQVPPDAPSGAAVDVVISYAGGASKTVTVAVE
jgi:uncharacterized protein (TIGR03437 family)